MQIVQEIRQILRESPSVIANLVVDNFRKSADYYVRYFGKMYAENRLPYILLREKIEMIQNDRKIAQEKRRKLEEVFKELGFKRSWIIKSDLTSKNGGLESISIGATQSPNVVMERLRYVSTKLQEFARATSPENSRVCSNDANCAAKKLGKHWTHMNGLI